MLIIIIDCRNEVLAGTVERECKCKPGYKKKIDEEVCTPCEVDTYASGIGSSISIITNY